MNQLQLERFARRLALVSGALDFCTGLALVFAPALLLRLMGVPGTGEEATVYLRFIGMFVWAVGFSYLWALGRGEAALLRSTLELTVWFRLAVGGYSSFAIARGWLSPLWLSVPAADFAFAFAQIWLLRRGVFRPE